MSVTRRVRVLGLAGSCAARCRCSRRFTSASPRSTSAPTRRPPRSRRRAGVACGGRSRRAPPSCSRSGSASLLFVVLPARLTGWLGVHGRLGFGLVDGLFRMLAFLALPRAHQPVEGNGARARLPRRRAQGDPRDREWCAVDARERADISATPPALRHDVPVHRRAREHRGVHVHREAARDRRPSAAGGVHAAHRRASRSSSFAGRASTSIIGWVRALTWPGMQFQRLTTREPDLSMCATAIAALEKVRDDRDDRPARARRRAAPRRDRVRPVR